MDLVQRKLTKAEWESIEIPEQENEKEILKMILHGYSNVNITINKSKSILSYLKINSKESIEYEKCIQSHIYNVYFSSIVSSFKTIFKETEEEYEFLSSIQPKSKQKIKKVDAIRVDLNDISKVKHLVFEYILLNELEFILKKKDVSYHYFTLYKLSKNNIERNEYVNKIINFFLKKWEDNVCFRNIVHQCVKHIEENEILAQYTDKQLYDHQKNIFTLTKLPDPKLILYIAPTGTGKTLTPLALSENYKIIFVCAARHVGLAFARSCITMNKKIAFAFGCKSTDEIRLHYFSAKDYVKDRKSGGIFKVDNSVGDKVEIMICDIQSYLSAMYYMMAFEPDCHKLLTYWDEPTITMDYTEHPLHEIIHKNWSENLIPNIVLSSATLPKAHELPNTISHFYEKFPNGQIHSIISHDCKKSIPLINNNGFVVLPHYLTDDYQKLLVCVKHCKDYLTILRYFDLPEISAFLQFMEEKLSPKNQIDRHFTSLDDITIQNIKEYYLYVLENIQETEWAMIFGQLQILRKQRIVNNDTIDIKGVRKTTEFRKIKSIGPGINVTPPVLNNQCAMYITTKDAYTLTDGPTIFLTQSIEKIANFYIQQSNIPKIVMDSILAKIEFNNNLNEKISILEKKIEDISHRNETTNDKAVSKPKTGKKEKNIEEDSSLRMMAVNLEKMQGSFKSVQLNDVYIPNKLEHVKKWMNETSRPERCYTSDIDEITIIQIMSLKVDDGWKILLLLGIGVFTNHENIEYIEIMKKMASLQRLYLIIADTDYIYGTNYQFCHGYISKDLQMSQDKIFQAIGRTGRGNIHQTYTIRFRDDNQLHLLFYPTEFKPEMYNMNRLFSGDN